MLIDPGGSYQGAAMIDAAIDGITDRPVTHVINTGGQDHRWLGNGYWQERGATVIASQAAVADQTARASMQMTALTRFLGDALDGTEPSFADVTFDSDHTLDVGGLSFEIMHRGPAHTPGDSFVWLPARDVMFTGDIVYVERILGVGPQSDVTVGQRPHSCPSRQAGTPAPDPGRAHRVTGSDLVFLRLEGNPLCHHRRVADLADIAPGLLVDRDDQLVHARRPRYCPACRAGCRRP